MTVLGSRVDLNDVLGLHFFRASDFQLYQLFTYMFMHASLQHLFFNMFALWMFGCVVENVWGSKKFLLYYMVCGVGAGLLQEATQYCSFIAEGLTNYDAVSLDGYRMAMGDYLNRWTTVGASGAIYGVLLAFGMLFPEDLIFIFPLPIPIKAKWFVCIYVGVELFSALGSTDTNVAHFAHLGGMLFGYILIRYWQKHSYYGEDYGLGRGRQFFDNLRNNWERRSHKKAEMTVHRGGAYNGHESDWEYNARKKANQEEIDRILDKIRRSGYDSLTRDEKQSLFDASKN
jgi:membrane associated rhomboid family serine protease